MKVEIIEDHPAGLVKGQIKTLSLRDANALIKMKIAKEYKETKRVSKTK